MGSSRVGVGGHCHGMRPAVSVVASTWRERYTQGGCTHACGGGVRVRERAGPPTSCICGVLPYNNHVPAFMSMGTREKSAGGMANDPTGLMGTRFSEENTPPYYHHHHHQHQQQQQQQQQRRQCHDHHHHVTRSEKVRVRRGCTPGGGRGNA